MKEKSEIVLLVGNGSFFKGMFFRTEDETATLKSIREATVELWGRPGIPGISYTCDDFMSGPFKKVVKIWMRKDSKPESYLKELTAIMKREGLEWLGPESIPVTATETDMLACRTRAESSLMESESNEGGLKRRSRL